MCGRFTIMTDLELLLTRFSSRSAIDDFHPRYNVAPTQNVLSVIRHNDENRMGYLRWGLVPSWSNDPSIGNKLINARAETLMEKPSFKESFKRRRCLIVADSFYEWKTVNGKRQPVQIMLKNEQPFAFAGIWDKWSSPEGNALFTCSIVTTEPNELLSPIHNRMPVILSKENESAWLDTKHFNYEELTDLFASFPSSEMKLKDVSDYVNSPFHDDSRCIESLA